MLALLVGGHGWAFAYALRFYAVGPGGPANPLSFLAEPEWTSRWGPAWCFLALFVAALAGVAVLAWRAAGTSTSSDPGYRGDAVRPDPRAAVPAVAA